MNTRRVVLYQIGGSPQAYKFSTKQKGDNTRDLHIVWVPKSIIEHITRRPAQELNQWDQCEVELPEWFLDKNNL